MGRDGKWIENVMGELDCDEMEEDFRKSDNPSNFNNTPTKETHWNRYFDSYHATVDRNFKLLPYKEYQPKAWKVPIEIKFSPVNGRGVYAKEFIPEGAPVWNSKWNTALFANSHEYRQFLEHLVADPDNMKAVCDTSSWYDVIGKSDNLYSHSTDKEEFIVCMTFDEATLLNEDLAPKKNKINLDIKAAHAYNGCGGYQYFAKRNIQPGEELIISYDVDKLMNSGFAAMGLTIYDPHKKTASSGLGDDSTKNDVD
ncbi:MAG: hypothetical protein SGARI_004964, partial [Bacillariaceae sp.]